MVLRVFRTALRRHPVLTAAFALSALMALAFLTRFAIGTLLWQSRADEPVRPWMTLGYVAHARGLSPQDLSEAAGLPPPERGHPLTLAEIAVATGLSEAEVVARIEAALAAQRDAAGTAQDGGDGG